MNVLPQTHVDYLRQKIQVNETCSPYSKRWANLGFLYDQLARLEEPRTHYPNAIKAFRKALVLYFPSRSPHVHAIIQHRLGGAYQNLAVAETRHVSTEKNHSPAKENTSPPPLQQRAAHHATLVTEAFQQALKFFTETDHPDRHVQLQFNLGTCHFIVLNLTGDLPHGERAIEAFNQVLQKMTKEIVQRKPEVGALTRYKLGAVYQRMGQLQQSNEDYQKGIAFLEAALPGFDPAIHPTYVRATHSRLGGCYYALTKFGDPTYLATALQHYEAVRALVKVTRPNHPKLLIRLANLYIKFGRKEKPAHNFQLAITHLTDALTMDISPEWGAQIQRITGDAYHLLAEVVDPVANYTHAIERYQQALTYYSKQNPAQYDTLTHNLTLTQKLLEIETANI